MNSTGMPLSSKRETFSRKLTTSNGRDEQRYQIISEKQSRVGQRFSLQQKLMMEGFKRDIRTSDPSSLQKHSKDRSEPLSAPKNFRVEGGAHQHFHTN